jgi:hypothetical protein
MQDIDLITNGLWEDRALKAGALDEALTLKWKRAVAEMVQVR